MNSPETYSNPEPKIFFKYIKVKLTELQEEIEESKYIDVSI